MKKAVIRLRLKIMATLAEEIAIVLVVLLVLPRFGVRIPLPGLIGMMAGLAVWAVITYRLAGRALEKKPMAGLSTMVGSRGKVVSPLDPKGLIKIGDELWEAKTGGQRIDIGEEVMVVEQDGLKLVVRRSTSGYLKKVE
jgi:membrane-bound ClpP family serine protease